MGDVIYRLRALQDLEHTDMRRGDLLSLYGAVTDAAAPHILSRHVAIDPGIILVGLNTGVLEPVILTPGACPSSSRAAVEQAVAEVLRPQLRLVRSMG